VFASKFAVVRGRLEVVNVATVELPNPYKVVVED
jgi:hypothetical protein